MATNNPEVQVPPVKVPEGAAKPEQTVDEELDKEFIEKKSIVISLVGSYSNYRKANALTLGARKETVGSSITSSRILASNKGEIEAYFPSLLGLSPNNPDFITRVKAWLSNIHFVVTDSDKILNTSFIWNKKRDYITYKKKEDGIYDTFIKIDRTNTTIIKEAVKRFVEDMTALESTKYQYGRPQNLEEYLMYRHCLLYRDVAKDAGLINSDPSLRFYIKDAAKEAEKQKQLTEERLKAMRNFIELSASPSKFNAVYIALIASRNENISEALLKDSSSKNTVMMDFVNSYPDKFNKMFNDKNIITKAFIETLIVRGELIRAEYNQQISTADGTFIGSNMKEAVAYFNNPNNADMVSVYKQKLKLF